MIYFESEKAFEKMLMENKDFLAERFGRGEFFNQVTLGHYGICDILSIGITPAFDRKRLGGYDSIDVNIIELKNTGLKYEHLGQCARYKTFFDRANIEGLDVRVSLVGTGWDIHESGDLCFLLQSIPWLDCYTAEIKLFGGLDLNSISGWRRGLDSDIDIASALRAAGLKESSIDLLEAGYGANKDS